MSRIWRFAHILWLSILLIYPSNAEDELGFHDIRLISEKNAVSHDDKSAIIAIDIELTPNWKTYWRSPGQTGILHFRGPNVFEEYLGEPEKTAEVQSKKR